MTFVMLQHKAQETSTSADFSSPAVIHMEEMMVPLISIWVTILSSGYERYHSQVGKDIKQDAIGWQCQPYPTNSCIALVQDPSVVTWDAVPEQLWLLKLLYQNAGEPSSKSYCQWASLNLKIKSVKFLWQAQILEADSSPGHEPLSLRKVYYEAFIFSVFSRNQE